MTNGIERTPRPPLMVYLSRCAPLVPAAPSFMTRTPARSSQHIPPDASFKERRIEVRTVNLRMAEHARLEKARLVVERRRSRCPAKAGRRVALQAQQVHVAQLQHVRIGSAMHQVAGLAAVNLYRLVLEHKRPLLVRVALETHLILRGGSPHLPGLHRSMRIVAIGALNQSFINPMVERHVELRFLLEMA